MKQYWGIVVLVGLLIIGFLLNGGWLTPSRFFSGNKPNVSKPFPTSALPDEQPMPPGDGVYPKGGINPIGDVACTMEAKICPDGSSVGRVPPDCEFAPCPRADGQE